MRLMPYINPWAQQIFPSLRLFIRSIGKLAMENAKGADRHTKPQPPRHWPGRLVFVCSDQARSLFRLLTTMARAKKARANPISISMMLKTGDRLDQAKSDRLPILLLACTYQ